MHETDRTSTGVALLRQAVGQIQSSTSAIESELELAARLPIERLPTLLLRVRSLAGIARDAAQMAEETLHVMVGAAPPIPSLAPEDAAKGTARHRRAETEPGEETDPGGAW